MDSHGRIMYGMEYGPWMCDVILYNIYTIILVYMLAHMNILFDLRLLNVLLLYYY